MGFTEIIVVGSCGMIIGLLISYLLFRNKSIGNWIEKFLTKDGRVRNKIINNPELLKKELEKNSEIIDIADVSKREKISYKVVEEKGKKKLVEEREKMKDEEEPKKKAPKKKAVKKKK